jgi:hypothetical protein
LGKQQGKLYYLVALALDKTKRKPLMTITNHPSCFQNISLADLCHRRLGHLYSSRLSFMAESSLKFPFKAYNACDVCAFAKQKKLIFFIICLTF